MYCKRISVESFRNIESCEVEFSPGVNILYGDNAQGKTNLIEAIFYEKSFTDEQKETFEKFHDCWSEYMSLAEAAIFEYAFKLGMQIAIETLIE